MDKQEQYIELYKSLGLMESTEREKGFPLHQRCEKAEKCWSQAQERRPNESDYRNSIYAPYLGANYEKTRLFIVAENMNEYGGWNAIDGLVKGAIKEISDGRSRVRFGNDWKNYRGSYLWHRLGAYGIAFAERLGIVKDLHWQPNGFPSLSEVCNGFAYLAYTNHVKCSPKGSRSKPTGEMWENCGRRILRREIELADPSFILVLGTSSNRWAFENHIFSTMIPSPGAGTASFGKALIGEKKVNYIVLPHPSFFRISPSRVIGDFKRAITELLNDKWPG